MKRNATIISLALALCAVVGTMALAKGKSRRITFDQDMLVNGALASFCNLPALQAIRAIKLCYLRWHDDCAMG